MRSQILKDIYNILPNIRALLIVLAVFVFVLPASGAEAYVIMTATMCGYMLMTTFAYDDMSKWQRYARVMPISKKAPIRGKFVFSAMLSAMGSLLASIAVVIYSLIKSSDINISKMLLTAFIAGIVGFAMSSTALPIVIKFGVEKARLVVLVAYLAPVVLVLGSYYLMKFIGINTESITFQTMTGIFGVVFALIWAFLMYVVSCRIFLKKDL